MEAESIAKEYLVSLPDDEQHHLLVKRIISSLALYVRNNHWWPAAWKILISNKGFAREVFDAIGDWRSSPYLRYLTETQLNELYSLATEVYPYADDIDFHGGSVPAQYTRQEWREGILQELAGRGTAEGVAILDNLYQQIPEHPELGYLLTQAKARFRLESWIAPSPSVILRLVSDSQRRYVRNSGQLLELIIDTLHGIKQAFNASAVMKNSVWHRQSNGNYRPANEEEFSNAIAEWLGERLRRTIINREPQTGFISYSRERTDIQVETFGDNDERLMVIIEVKGCWYQQIYQRMQSQLVNQYLAKHDRCHHGLYLVGYFASDHWDTSDPRRQVCSTRQKEILDRELKVRAKALVAPKSLLVETLVFDASL